MSKRRQWLAGEIEPFLRQYARKHNRGVDPNDRTYDREIEQIIRKMSPEDLDEARALQCVTSPCTTDRARP